MLMVDEDKRENQCFVKAVRNGEPTFTLRAQDITSHAVVQYWLDVNPQLSEERKQEVKDKLAAIDYWQHMNHTKVKKAD